MEQESDITELPARSDLRLDNPTDLITDDEEIRQGNGNHDFGRFRTVSTRARARLNGNLELSRRIISFVTHDEQKSLRCMRSYGCVRVSLPLRPDDRVGHAATFPVFRGWF